MQVPICIHINAAVSIIRNVINIFDETRKDGSNEKVIVWSNDFVRRTKGNLINKWSREERNKTLNKTVALLNFIKFDKVKLFLKVKKFMATEARSINPKLSHKSVRQKGQNLETFESPR